MRKRGKVLRDPYAGPGLLMIEGRQYPFLLTVWKSEGPPKPGLAVDVDFAENGQILAISMVSESQIAKERCAAAGQKKGWRLLDKLAAWFGMTRIIEPASSSSRRQP
jgi:hypothetical protein